MARDDCCHDLPTLRSTPFLLLHFQNKYLDIIFHFYSFPKDYSPTLALSQTSNMSIPTPTLLLIGSGPGIGLATSTLFAQKKFSKIALISRNASRLVSEAESISSAVSKSGKQVEVKTWAVDVVDSARYKKVLEEVGDWGEVTCVVFNAARVQPSPLLEFAEEEILADFQVQFRFSFLLTKIQAPLHYIHIKHHTDNKYRPL